MGRIDDALRRADAGRDDRPANPGRADVFQSAWDPVAQVGDASPASPTRPAHFAQEWTNLLALSPESNPAMVAQFNRMAGTLHTAQVANGLKIVLVTSVDPGEGKTLTALNLALTLSNSYRRSVLLVDADLRRPSIHQVCGFDRLRGLSHGLRSKQHEKLSVIQLSETLSMLPAGAPDPDPMDALTSERMQGILEEAGSRFDWVIVDAAPIGVVPDAGLLAGMVDAVIFVIRAETTPHEQIAKAIDAVGRERIFGVVLNGITAFRRKDYGSYYHPHPQQPSTTS